MTLAVPARVHPPGATRWTTLRLSPNPADHSSSPPLPYFSRHSKVFSASPGKNLLRAQPPGPQSGASGLALSVDWLPQHQEHARWTKLVPHPRRMIVFWPKPHATQNIIDGDCEARIVNRLPEQVPQPSRQREHAGPFSNNFESRCHHHFAEERLGYSSLVLRKPYARPTPISHRNDGFAHERKSTRLQTTV